MEYTKVQTALNHVKDAIIAKIDKVDASVTSVKNSVTNLPTTLDSKFSALTSKVDGVKTDVAGVGSKVDGASNTLNIIKNNTETLSPKEDVAYIGKSIGKQLNSITTVNALDIKGSGCVKGITVGNFDDGVELRVTIDGVSKQFKKIGDNQIFYAIYPIMQNVTEATFAYSSKNYFSFTANINGYAESNFKSLREDVYTNGVSVVIGEISFDSNFKIDFVETKPSTRTRIIKVGYILKS